jgi:hypothetical protein
MRRFTIYIKQQRAAMADKFDNIGEWCDARKFSNLGEWFFKIADKVAP